MTSLSLSAKFWQPGHRQLLSGHQPFTLSSSFNRVVLALAAQLLQGPAGLLKISGRDTVVHCAVRARPGKDELLGKPRGAGSLGCLASPGQQNTGNASCCPPRTTMGIGVGVMHAVPPRLTSALQYCCCHPQRPQPHPFSHGVLGMLLYAEWFPVLINELLAHRKQ